MTWRQNYELHKIEISLFSQNSLCFTFISTSAHKNFALTLLYSLEFYELICIQITFNNSLKVYFSNKKNTVTSQTRLIQIVKVYFLLKTGVKRIFKDFWCTN